MGAWGGACGLSGGARDLSAAARACNPFVVCLLSALASNGAAGHVAGTACAAKVAAASRRYAHTIAHLPLIAAHSHNPSLPCSALPCCAALQWRMKSFGLACGRCGLGPCPTSKRACTWSGTPSAATRCAGGASPCLRACHRGVQLERVPRASCIVPCLQGPPRHGLPSSVAHPLSTSRSATSLPPPHRVCADLRHLWSGQPHRDDRVCARRHRAAGRADRRGHQQRQQRRVRGGGWRPRRGRGGRRRREQLRRRLQCLRYQERQRGGSSMAADSGGAAWQACWQRIRQTRSACAKHAYQRTSLASCRAGLGFRLTCLLCPPPPPPPLVLCSPVFNELGEVVGIAFQSYAGSDAENIG